MTKLRVKLDSMKEISMRNDEASEEFENSKILAVLVDVYGSGTAEKVWIHRDLQEYYQLLQCNTIDMPMRRIGGRLFQIICDDEGLLRSDYKVSAFGNSIREPMLVGNLLICQYHGGEEIDGLTDEEADYVMLHTRDISYSFNGCPERRRVIKNMSY